VEMHTATIIVAGIAQLVRDGKLIAVGCERCGPGDKPRVARIGNEWGNSGAGTQCQIEIHGSACGIEGMLAQKDALAKKRICEDGNEVKVVHLPVVERELVCAGLLSKQP